MKLRADLLRIKLNFSECKRALKSLRDNFFLTMLCFQLKDGVSPEAEKIANLRGNSSRKKYATAFGGLQVIFRSDESIVKAGFHLTYKIGNYDI